MPLEFYLGQYEPAIATVQLAQLPHLLELLVTPDFYPQGMVPPEIRQPLGVMGRSQHEVI